MRKITLSQAAVEMGKKGGKSKSAEKKAAVRVNGRKGGRPKKMITILNDHAEIAETNFWNTEMARAGKFYCSINAGCLRILLPTQLMHIESDIATAKTIDVEREGACIVIWFDDGTPAPFRLTTTIEAFDRDPGSGEMRVIVYGPALRKIYDGAGTAA